ncbi:MAG TPA: C-terminal binding protein [Acidimicrobiales bacterium]|nr:C-terminal binding protein [Acidimicrobiales bacterium]
MSPATEPSEPAPPPGTGAPPPGTGAPPPGTGATPPGSGATPPAAVVFQSEVAGELAPYDYEEQTLAGAGVTLRVGRCASTAELVEAAAGARVIWIEWGPDLTAEALAELPELELVVRWGVGYDQIDTAAATRLGIAVANAPSYCTHSVAEHALALALALTRRIVASDREIHRGGFGGAGWDVPTIGGSTFGVVGCGRIGSRVARLASAFGCEVLANDIRTPGQLPEGITMVGLRQLLERSDLVTLHVPLTAETRHLIDAERLGWMKPGALLVNTSRGRVVDEAALVEALRSGRLAGAGLDVYETEPLPLDSPLRSLDNAVLTPHEAASSPASIVNLRAEICRVTLQWLAAGWADSVVNPEVRPSRRWRAAPC